MFKKRRQNFRQRRKSNDSDQESHSHHDHDQDDGVEPSSVTIPGLGDQNWVINLDPNEPFVKKKPKKQSKNGAGCAATSLDNQHKATSVLSFDHHDDEDHEKGEEFKIRKSSRSERIAKKLKKASRKEKEAETSVKKDGKSIEEQLRQKKVVHDYKHRSAASRSPPSDSSARNVSDERASDYDDPDDVDSDGGHKFRSVLETGNIPDANMIHLARKRRQLAREMQDFIPMTERRSKIKEKSRLVREENDDEDEEDAVPFSQDVHVRDRQRIRDEFMAAEHGSGDSDSDKDTWEAQQIKKAMNIPQVQPIAGASAGVASYVPAYRDPAPPMSHYAETEETMEVHKPPALSTKTDYTIEHLTKRLHESLLSLEGVHRVHRQEKTRCDEDLDLNTKTATECEAMVSVLERRYSFFQQMRGYVRDLVMCHNEKLPAITELEANYLTLVKDRAASRLKRRQQDVRDQSTDYNPMTAKTAPLHPVDTPRQRRTAEREARKGRRRRAREASGIVGHYDGLSTDEEETQSDMAKLNMERDRIREARTNLYADVLDEFCQIRKLMEQFEEWKFEHGESYREAYIGLCLPKLFSPLLKLELIDWNPLESSCVSLERMRWFEQLVLYGHDFCRVPDPEDVDLKLVPNIVEKFLLPRLTVLAEVVWDPLSKRESLLFVSVIERLAVEYPITADSKNLQALVRAVVNRIKKCIDDDIFMPLYPKGVLDNKFSPPSVFFSRQLWTCIKLFRNTLMWYEVLSPSILRQLTCDALLNRYILLGLQNSMNNHLFVRCQMIADSVPKCWFDDAANDSTIPELEKFCRFLVNLALNRDRRAGHATTNEGGDPKEIIKLLVNLHAMDHAMEVSRLCGTKL